MQYFFLLALSVFLGAAPAAANTCGYSFFPVATAIAFTSAAGTGAISVYPSPDTCSWTVTVDPQATWITITAGGTGLTGTGQVNYSVAANTAALPRSGTITAAGQVFTITQAGAGFTLTATKDGAGTGTVTSAPSGITCGTVCSSSYAGATVTLSAAPDPGDMVSGWTGCDSYSGNDCVVAVTANKTVKVSFSPIATNGVCGVANAEILPSPPATGLCATGTASPVNGSGPWSWSCAGANGGTAANCSAQMLACGAASGQASSTAPVADLCADGTPGAISGGNGAPWSWSCGGALGAVVNCAESYVPPLINGACGTANGGITSAKPASGLCAAGTASPVTGTRAWTWSCVGTNGGATASCLSRAANYNFSFPAGASPSADAPAALALDSGHQRIYVVQRGAYEDVNIAPGSMLTDRVSVVNETTGQVMAAIPIGQGPNGAGQGIAVDTALNRVFVGNALDKTVSIIDGSTDSVTSTVPISQPPAGIAVDVSLGKVFVAGGNSIIVLDANSGTVKDTIPLSDPAYSVTVDESAHMVYVGASGGPPALIAINGQTDAVAGRLGLSLLYGLAPGIAYHNGVVYLPFSSANTLVAVDVSSPAAPKESLRIATPSPHGVAVDPVTGQICVTSPDRNLVNVYDPNGGLLKSIGTRRLPVAVALDPVARKAYVADAESDSLTVVDADLLSVSDTWLLGNTPWGLAYDSSQKRIYAANYLTDTVSVLDGATGAVIGNWYSGANPAYLALDEGRQRLYVANLTDKTLSIMDTGSGGIVATLPLGGTPSAVAVSPALHRAYVTLKDSGALTVVDGGSLAIAANIKVGNGPSGVAVDDTAHLVYVANQQGGSVSVIDMDTNALATTFSPQQGNVWGVSVDHALNYLYLTCPPANIGDFSGLEVLNAASGSFVGQIATGSAAQQVISDPGSHDVFVSDSGDGTVSLINGNNGALTLAPASGSSKQAIGMSINNELSLLYVSNPFDGLISCVDLASTLKTNGVCGASNGGAFAAAPTADLCAAGTASAPTGNGPWAWTCGGTYGGLAASCAAVVKMSPSDCLFNWAEQNYASLFAPAGSGTVESAPYAYRYYGQTNSYLGVSSVDGHLYYLGPSPGMAMMDLGLASEWYARAGCQ